MPTNSGEEQRAEQALSKLTSLRPPPVQEITGDIARYADALIDRILQVGKYTLEHGQYVERMSVEFAQHLDKLITQYAIKLRESEQRKVAEQERILGHEPTERPQA